MNGCRHDLLRVDLTSQRCYREPLAAELLQQQLGGRSLGVALLQEYAGLAATAAEMPLVICPGLLCDTGLPMSTRCVLTGRSPLSGTLYSCSSGGAFAAQLHAAGIAALVIQGRSTSPCLLAIKGVEQTLKPAPSLWGLETVTVTQQLGHLGAVAAIGPAGEQQVGYASLETSAGESFNRGGLGAVLGYKGLKAIVVQGDCQQQIVDQVRFDKALEDLLRLFRASPFLLGPLGIHAHGTSALVDLLHQRGMVPGPNFKDFVGKATNWNARALQQFAVSHSGGCSDCFVACKRVCAADTILPDYDELAAFGGLCGINDLAAICQLVDQCHALGVDPVSCAGTLATWSECVGQPLTAGLLIPLLKEIADTTGQGQLLANGALAVATALDKPELAMVVKGMELSPYDPRASTGLALGLAVATHAGSHLNAWPLASEILRKPVPTDRFSFDGKARVIAMFEDMGAALDSLGICRFAAAAIELEELAALVSGVFGRACCAAELQQIGRRTVLRERAFNRACGFSAADDNLPQRFFSEPANGLAPLDQERFGEELAAYHRIRAAQEAA